MRLKTLKRLGLTLLFIGLLSTSYIAYGKTYYSKVSQSEIASIREKLAHLSLEERKDLSFFFQHGALFDQYGFTLVGHKPMSVLVFVNNPKKLCKRAQLDLLKPEVKEQTESLKRGWEVWCKYQGLFLNNKYALVKFNKLRFNGVNNRRGPEGLTSIVLIHKELCKNTIEAHLSDFQEILKEELSADAILEILTKPDYTKVYQIIGHDRLLGTLLGFGRDNAHLFALRDAKKLKSFSTEWPYWPRKWRLPGFLADPISKETQKLQNFYKQARHYIYWSYFGRDLLEVSLALLNQESPPCGSSSISPKITTSSE